jgi:hypothetical protein
MPKFFRVTYEIVTHESAKRGEVAEYGYIHPDGCRVNTTHCTASRGFWLNHIRELTMRLRDALMLVDVQQDCGRWWQQVDGDRDYQTGEVERRALHPPHNITPASYARVTRLLKL